MSNDQEKKKFNNEGLNEAGEEFIQPLTASRARNRTVMLSQDVTDQVRSMLKAPVSGNAPSEYESRSEVFKTPKDLISNLASTHTESKDDQDKKPSFDRKRRETQVTMIHESPFMARSEKRVGDTLSIDPKEKITSTVEIQKEVKKHSTMDGEFKELSPTLGRRDHVSIDGESFKKLTGRDYVSVNKTSNKEQEDQTSSPSPKRLIRRDEEFVTNRQSPNQNSSVGGTALMKPEDLKKRAEISEVPADAKVVGFFVTYDRDENGQFTVVRAGRWVISGKMREDSDLIVLEDSSISPSHAVLKASRDGVVQIMDQLSDKGTAVLKPGIPQEINASDGPVRVQHGDMIRLGRRYYIYCAIPKIQIKN